MAKPLVVGVVISLSTPSAGGSLENHLRAPALAQVKRLVERDGDVVAECRELGEEASSTRTGAWT
uniref:Uncharacterized protein n=1 Tax=Streptomyces sp. NBC_00180 TaxID=2903632 RepID=A0AAU1HQK2_9ACTN